MIRITTVHGDVLVDDKKTGHSQMARDGMALDAAGNYLIATTATSRAVIAANGKVIKLEPSTYLHIRGDRSSWERHQETWTGHAKRFLGRLWARIDRSSRDPDAGVQGGGGVRG